MPRHQVGVVLHRRDDDLVSRSDVFLRPCVGHEVDGLGCVPGPDDLLWLTGVDEFRDLHSGTFVQISRLLAKVVNAAMNVGIGILVVVHQRFNDLTRRLGSGGIVQIDQRLFIDLSGQNWKIFPNFLYVVHHRSLGTSIQRSVVSYRSTSMSSPSTRTSNTSMGTTAGRAFTSPVRTSKRAM